MASINQSAAVGASLKSQSGAGADVEHIFILTAEFSPPPPANMPGKGFVPTGWTNHRIGVDRLKQCEWVSVRRKTGTVWSVFSTPIVVEKYIAVGNSSGADSAGFEYIFQRTTVLSAPSTPATAQMPGFVPMNWTDDPVGISGSYRFEWTATRSKIGTVWSEFSAPVLWAKLGAAGADSADVEYVFQRSADSSAPSTPVTAQMKGFVPQGWTDDPIGVNSFLQYEWSVFRSKTGTVWSEYSTPVLWEKFGLK